MIYLRCLVLIAASLLASESSAADCSVEGPIAQSAKLHLAKALSRGCKTLYLSSPGGDVNLALEMGRAIRRYETHVVVPRGASCDSACVLLYAAGVTRTPYGYVRIHRPYHIASSSSLAAEQARYDKLGEKIRTYLRQMNVREALFEEMMRVPPEEARALALDEQYQLSLGLTDPVYAEYRDARQARAAGISKTQFLARKRATAELCGGGIYDEPVPSDESETRLACWKRHFPDYVGEKARAP